MDTCPEPEAGEGEELIVSKTKSWWLCFPPVVFRKSADASIPHPTALCSRICAFDTGLRSEVLLAKDLQRFPGSFQIGIQAGHIS